MFDYAYSVAFNYFSILENVLHDERFSYVYNFIMRMSFSASNIIVNVVVLRVCVCVCVCLFEVFFHHVHLDPEI